MQTLPLLSPLTRVSGLNSDWFHIILKFGGKQVRVNEKGLMPEMLVVILQG